MTTEPVLSEMTTEDLQRACADLRKEHRTKGGLTYSERRACLKSLLKSVRARKEALAQAVCADFGHRSRDDTFSAEIFPVINGIKHALKELRGWMAPEAREVAWPWLPASCKLVHQPLGVVGVISPWNYPIGSSLEPVIAALAAGNRVLLKPSEEVPHVAALLKEILEDDLGTDIARVTPGGAEVGAAFASLPLDHLLFTGSTAVGRRVMAAASALLTPVTLELGGKSPALIHPSYSLGTAAKRIAYGKLLNSGQTCIAPDYALVHKDKVDGFVRAYKDVVSRYYPTIADNADYTSIINERHYDRIQKLVADAKAEGAEVIPIKGSEETLSPEARKIAPTLVLGVNREMAIMKEEIFGPVLPIIPYDSLDQAIEFINDGDRPLALYYFDSRNSRVESVLARTISGGVGINETLMQYAQESLPFGGVGASGMGSYHGHAGFLTFSHARPVFHQARIHALGLMAPPHGGIGRALIKFLIG